ncbi:hypothetical protein M0804_001627 [Polistes exclamans]|nr:hypothetical protein M0804_001627 [Polistes exclamans]
MGLKNQARNFDCRFQIVRLSVSSGSSIVGWSQLFEGLLNRNYARTFEATRNDGRCGIDGRTKDEEEQHGVERSENEEKKNGREVHDGRQASKQASKQAVRQASKQASKQVGSLGGRKWAFKCTTPEEDHLQSSFN